MRFMKPRPSFWQVHSPQGPKSSSPSGRTGVLCAACTTEYYATKGECKRCTEVSQEDKLHLWGIAAGVAAIGLGLAGMAWLSRGAATEYWQQARGALTLRIEKGFAL